MTTFQIALRIIAVCCWVTVGIINIMETMQNKQRLRLTPFPASVSWLLLINCILYAVNELGRAVG